MNLVLIHVNCLNLSKFLAVVLSNICVNVVRDWYNSYDCFNFSIRELSGNNAVNHNNSCVSACNY